MSNDNITEKVTQSLTFFFGYYTIFTAANSNSNSNSNSSSAVTSTPKGTENPSITNGMLNARYFRRSITIHIPYILILLTFIDIQVIEKENTRSVWKKKNSLSEN